MITTKNNAKYIVTNQDIFESIEKRLQAKHIGASILVPHVCNNIDLFGAGFAKAIADRYPSVKANYHLLGKTFLKNNLGHSQFLSIYEEPQYKHKLYIVNMIAQNGIRSPSNIRPLNYAALAKCMSQITNFINSHTDSTQNIESMEIHAPKFGSGLSGGNWNFISDLIEDIWGKQMVYVYDYSKK